MRIVTDGKDFAIEKGWIFKRYYSVQGDGHWWFSWEFCFKYCWGSRERIEIALEQLNRKKNITPIKVDE